MEKINPFENISDSNFEGGEALKEMLVSEIGVIRESLTIVNLFFGEALLSAIKYIQVFEPKNDNN